MTRTAPAGMGTNGVEAAAAATSAAVSPMDTRMSELETLFLGGPLAAHLQVAKSFSIETLVDVLVVLFDECSSSSLRREKTVSEFIELGEKINLFSHILMHPHNGINFFVCLNKRKEVFMFVCRPRFLTTREVPQLSIPQTRQ